MGLRLKEISLTAEEPEQETVWKRPQERSLHKPLLYDPTVQVPVSGTGPLKSKRDCKRGRKRDHCIPYNSQGSHDAPGNHMQVISNSKHQVKLAI